MFHAAATRQAPSMRWRTVSQTRALEDAARFVEIATGVQHEFDPQPSDADRQAFVGKTRRER
jgi:hypothetical protein